MALARRRTDPRAGELGETLPAPAVRGRERNYRVLLALADTAAAGTCVAITISLGAPDRLRASFVVVVPMIVVLAKIAGLYDHDELVIRKSTLVELPRLFQLATLVSLVVWLARPAVVSASPGSGTLLLLWVSLFAAITALRVAARWLAGVISPPERCVVLGGQPAFERLSGKLAGNRNVELVDRLSLHRVARDAKELGRFAAEHDIHRVVIAPDGAADPAEILTAVGRAKSSGLRVSVLPGILESVEGSVVFDDLDGLLLFGVPRFGLTRSSAAVKRCFDVAAAVLLLGLTAPVIGFVAILIKLDTSGPILFRQVRVGRGRERFRMYKLRTMVDGADAMKAGLAGLNEAGEEMFKIDEDPRITRVGRWLRRTSFDELPQLVNVLRGDMSLVGPRPLIAAEDELIVAADSRRSQLTPGMTGPWQILGGATRVPLAEMVKLDCTYVANWSLWNDVTILLRTIPVVLARRGR